MVCLLCGGKDPLPRSPGNNLLCEECYGKAVDTMARACELLGCTEGELTEIVRGNAQREKILAEVRKERILREAMRRYRERTP